MKKFLGLEFGSTRIKAVLIDETFATVSSGDYTWKSSFENGVWTYPLEEAWKGLNAALGGVEGLEDVAAAGVSGMMHGYLAFDKDWNLLVPFRTWQNTMTAQAAERADRSVRLQHSPALEHCAPVSGDSQRRGARLPHRPHHHAGRLHPSRAHRRQRRGRGRGLGHVPHRRQDRRLRRGHA